MEFRLYASKGLLLGSYLKVCHRELYYLGMKRGQLTLVFSRWQNNGIYCVVYSTFFSP